MISHTGSRHIKVLYNYSLLNNSFAFADFVTNSKPTSSSSPGISDHIYLPQMRSSNTTGFYPTTAGMISIGGWVYALISFIVTPLLANPMALAGLPYPLTANPRQLLRGTLMMSFQLSKFISCQFPLSNIINH